MTRPIACHDHSLVHLLRVHSQGDVLIGNGWQMRYQSLSPTAQGQLHMNAPEPDFQHHCQPIFLDHWSITGQAEILHPTLISL